MRAYPKVADMPSRKMRKAQRKRTWVENSNAMEVARKARRAKRLGEMTK